MIMIESMITSFANQSNILTDRTRYNQREIISTSDIAGFVSVIDKYVSRQNSRCEKSPELQKLEAETMKIRADTENKHAMFKNKLIEYKMHKFTVQQSIYNYIHQPVPLKQLPMAVQSSTLAITHAPDIVSDESHTENTESDSSEDIVDEQSISVIPVSPPTCVVPTPQHVPTVVAPTPYPLITVPTKPSPAVKSHAIDKRSLEILKTFKLNKQNRDDVVECPCGKSVKKKSFHSHISTKEHKRNLVVQSNS
jgi:hypothetical protein